jgi:hypothetical protein
MNLHWILSPVSEMLFTLSQSGWILVPLLCLWVVLRIKGRKSTY